MHRYPRALPFAGKKKAIEMVHSEYLHRLCFVVEKKTF